MALIDVPPCDDLSDVVPNDKFFELFPDGTVPVLHTEHLAEGDTLLDRLENTATRYDTVRENMDVEACEELRNRWYAILGDHSLGEPERWPALRGIVLELEQTHGLHRAAVAQYLGEKPTYLAMLFHQQANTVDVAHQVLKRAAQLKIVEGASNKDVMDVLAREFPGVPLPSYSTVVGLARPHRRAATLRRFQLEDASGTLSVDGH